MADAERLGVDQDEGNPRGFGSAIDPGVVGTPLNHDVTGLELGGRIVERHLDLAGEDEALDGFEFLTMAEAGEVGHWSIVKKLNEKAGVESIAALAEWALPIQQRHLQTVLEGFLAIASREDPNEPG